MLSAEILPSVINIMYFLESKSTEDTPTPTPTAVTTSEAVTVQESGNSGGCQSNNSSSSSSDGAPEEFHVAMDTNENNLWTEDVMDEKLG